MRRLKLNQQSSTIFSHNTLWKIYICNLLLIFEICRQLKFICPPYGWNTFTQYGWKHTPNNNHHILLSTVGLAWLTQLGGWHNIVMILLKHIGMPCVCIGHVKAIHSRGLVLKPIGNWGGKEKKLHVQDPQQVKLKLCHWSGKQEEYCRHCSVFECHAIAFSSALHEHLMLSMSEAGHAAVVAMLQDMMSVTMSSPGCGCTWSCKWLLNSTTAMLVT